MRIYVDLEPETIEEVMKLKKRMGCKTKTEIYRSVIVAGIEVRKKEFRM